MTKTEWVDQFVAELAKSVAGAPEELRAIAEPLANDGLRSSLTPQHQATSYKLRREQWVAEIMAAKKLPRLKASPAAVAFKAHWTQAFIGLIEAAGRKPQRSSEDVAEQAFVASGATLTPSHAFIAWRDAHIPDA